MKKTKNNTTDLKAMTVMVPISELKPSEYNPRKISDYDFDKLKQSIQRFGMPVPIIVNQSAKRKNIVVGGHQRLKAATDLGMKEVPVIYVDLDEKDEKVLNLSLNRISGEFDNSMLKSVFEGLSKADLDITGFYDHEVTKIMREMGDMGKDINEGTLEIKHVCPSCGYKF